MKNVEDVLPLSPMQELMLLHLAAARGSEALLEQMVLQLNGPVDAEALKRSWQLALDRHAALRASFLWEGLSKPVQVIRKQVELPWQQLDWTAHSDSDRRQRLEALLRDDRGAGFDATRAPLLRVTLVRIEGDSWWMVISAHHILLDRWSIGILLREVFAAHQLFSKGETPSFGRAPAYRDYLAHLNAKDSSAARAFWSDSLHGVTGAAAQIGGTADQVNPDQDCNGIEHVKISEQHTQRLRDLAVEHRLTLGALIQAALALAIAKTWRRDDLLLGVAVSSRPADVPGVERMVGMFSNNLPIRVQLPRQTSVAQWLDRLQQQQAGLSEHATTSLTTVRECAPALAADQPLFECLLVFQNDPAAAALADSRREFGLELQAVAGHSKTSFPLTVSVTDAAQIEIVLAHDRRRLGSASARELASAIVTSAQSIVDRPQAMLGELLGSAKPSLAASLLQAAAQVRPLPAALRSTNIDASQPKTVAAPKDLPATPEERAIADVWRELLRLDQIGKHDNFFDIGGTSVLAVQAVQRLKQRAKMKINPMQMAVQTLGQLASACSAGRS